MQEIKAPRWRVARWERRLLTALATAFCAELFFSIWVDNFRVSASVVLYPVLLVTLMQDSQGAGTGALTALMVLLVLCCARAGGISGGAVAGVAAGAIQGLATAGLSYLSGAYGLGGLMAGVFAPMGAVAAAVAFIISHGVASLQVGSGGSQIFTGSIEVAVATVAYMLPHFFRKMEELGLRLRLPRGSRIILAGGWKQHYAQEVDKGRLYAAAERVRAVAAPANCIRLGKKTPCAVTGRCGDCKSPDHICCDRVIQGFQRDPERIKVFLLPEDFGY